MDKSRWKYTGRKISEREKEEKDTEVIYCGRRLKQTTIVKETARHRNGNTSARFASGTEQAVQNTESCSHSNIGI